MRQFRRLLEIVDLIAVNLFATYLHIIVVDHFDNALFDSDHQDR